MRIQRVLPTCSLVIGTLLPALAQTGAGSIEPNAGSWKTWVLTSGSQLRLPPPPDPAAVWEEIERLRAHRSAANAAARDRADIGAPARPASDGSSW